MTLRALSAARHAGPTLSPAARITLMAMGDWCDDSGLVRNASEPMVGSAWSAITEESARDGHREIIELGLLHLEPLLPGDVGWLTFIPDWERAWEAAIRAHYPTTRVPVPQALRERVLERDGRRCVICGSPENLHVDHTHPASRGGLPVEANLQTLCRTHNLTKSDKMPAVTA